ncbi:hypothetical protein K450DRAFT_250451 [Umbelopsis ramanniana AG]|uniref:Uncharacterized protein n=1 Tax=Umbelopsis ramanniana AG TaxID=1314678 RepID=A0AAD5E6D2_UMBRA|nr:uncharacterized protein K450DRAFT_250451 [Umbelopsis ramanniana AG]KAI8577702.1 hypothetical protein K450DRAFT_250451 [Umbelopsis ramanniana AG]
MRCDRKTYQGTLFEFLFTVPCLMFYGIVTGFSISCLRPSAQWLHHHPRNTIFSLQHIRIFGHY